jgi:lipoprotein
MRKKITSLSVLLLSGAFLLTSCVKDEELESTKNLRTAKETREAEKLAEEKAEKELTQQGAKQGRVQALIDRQKTILDEISTAKQAIKTQEAANTGREAKKSLLQAEVDLAQEKLDRNIEQKNRQIAVIEHELASLENVEFADVTTALKEYNAKYEEKTAVTTKKEAAKKVYDEAKAAAVKALTDALVATDLFKALYKDNGNGQYQLIDNSFYYYSYVKNLAAYTRLDYRSQTVTSLADRSIPVGTDNDATKPTSNGYTYSDLRAIKTLAAQNLNSFLASVVEAEANVTPTEAQITAYANAVTTAQTALTAATNAYNADQTNATLRANYEAALQSFDFAQQILTEQTALRTRNLKEVQKARATYNVLNTAANFTAANEAINAYNGKLAELAGTWATWQALVDKEALLEAQTTALYALAYSTSKEDAVKALKDELTSLKETLNTLKKTQEGLKKTNVTDNTRDTEIAAAIIEANTAIIAAKTAELNYVKAQLTALGVQQ